MSDDFIDDAGRSAAPAAATTLAAPTMARFAGGPPLRSGREATLEATQGNISEASKRLGVSRNTIYRKLRRAQP